MARDTHAARDTLWKVIEQDPDDVVFEAIQELLKLPQDFALKLLLEIVFSDSVDELTLGKAVSTLISLGDRDSCSQLMAYIRNQRDRADSAILPILGNLDDYALDSRETKLIWTSFTEVMTRNRCAAAELLTDVRARFAARI